MSVNRLPANMLAKIAATDCPVEGLEGMCWTWTGCINSKGYGCVSIDGTVQLTHRVSYALHVAATTLHNVHARLVALEKQLKADRQQEIARAVNLQAVGNKVKASYHTGLADGHNTVIEAVRLWREALERAEERKK